MSSLSDLKGKRFGRLEVISYVGADSRGRSKWLCKCDCGKEITARVDSLKRGDTKSCGCYHAEEVAKYSRTHGLSRNRLYSVWSNMKNRCMCPTSRRFKDYGGRGISVCQEWTNSFLSFYEWAMESGYRQGLTIDRIDVDGNYEPSNCRWITNEEQQRNKRKHPWR